MTLIAFLALVLLLFTSPIFCPSFWAARTTVHGDGLLMAHACATGTALCGFLLLVGGIK